MSLELVTYPPINFTDADICYVVGRPPLAAAYLALGLLCIAAVLFTMLAFWMYDRFVVQERVQRKKDYERVYGSDDKQDDDGAMLLKKIRLEEQSALWMVWLRRLATPENRSGDIALIIGWVCSFISLLIYLVVVTAFLPSLEICNTMPNAAQIVDFFVNLYLLFYLIVRVGGSDRRFMVLLGPYTLLDYFVLPNALITLFFNRYFTGFQFLRAYNLLWLVPSLSYSGVLKKPSYIRLTYLACSVVATLFVATGFLHLVENKGDPSWLSEGGSYDGQVVNFWRCLLYLYGKLTLIDISNIKVLTNLGNIIVIIWQLAALGIIIAAITEIASRIRPTPEYDLEYPLPPRHLHVILTGHITEDAVAAVLGDFYHEDKQLSKYFKVVVLHHEVPSESMIQKMKQYYTRVDYRRGNILKPTDAVRVRVEKAAATIILVDRLAHDPDAADSLNIMRVIAVKDMKADARVVVELIQYHSKAYLRNIPFCSIADGDLALCIAELRLGLLAQSCYAPGFSTLLGNLFYCKSEAECRALAEKSVDPWMEPYSMGMALELYARRMSDDFGGMTFIKVWEFCYVRLKVLLIAVKLDSADLATAPQVNPPPGLVIKKGTTGYFLTDKADKAERAMYFCIRCHRDVEDPTRIKKCKCPDKQEERPINAMMAAKMSRKNRTGFGDDDRKPLPRGKGTWEAKMWMHIRTNNTAQELGKSRKAAAAAKKKKAVGDSGQDDKEEDEEDQPMDPDAEQETSGMEKGDFPTPRYDSTGMFHWRPARSVEEVTKTRQEVARMDLKGHIVVCVMSQPKAPPVGLHSFCLPLRSSAIKREQLRHILILTDHEFYPKEWRSLMNLPKITILKGTAIERADLRAAHLSACMQCVILSAPLTQSDARSDDAFRLADKAVILATLNIRAMKFTTIDEPKQIPDVDEDPDENDDRSSLAEKKKHLKANWPRQTGYEVPIITDLNHSSNVAYVDHLDSNKSRNFFTSLPYVTGMAFSGATLNWLVIEAFFHPSIIHIFRVLTFCGASVELEKVLAEGAGLIGGKHVSRKPQLKNQVIIKQFSVNEGPMASHAESSYGAMVVDAMKNHGNLCLGVYRKVDMTDESQVSARRFVVSNPSEDFILNPNDMVFTVERADYAPPKGNTLGQAVNDKEEFGDEYAEEEEGVDPEHWQE